MGEDEQPPDDDVSTPWKPPVWTAVWEPGCGDNWRMSLWIPWNGGHWHYQETTTIPVTRPHPGAARYRELGVAAFPGAGWVAEGPSWTRAVFPVTAAAEDKVLRLAQARGHFQAGASGED